MSRIQNETSKINDYYSTMPEPTPEESALDPLAAQSTKDHPLSQQMGNILQDFSVTMNEPDASKRTIQFERNIAQVEQLRTESRQLATQPGMDMGSIMLEVNQLLSKMRDAQRDHAIQQQQNALKMQETAYDHAQQSIDKNKDASLKKGLGGIIGGGVGAIGGISKVGSAVTSANWGKTKNGLGLFGDVLGASPALGTAVGELVSMTPTTEAQGLNRQSDREKEYQRLDETQSDRKEGDARDASQQMRSIQQQMADLYGKIVSAVRW